MSPTYRLGARPGPRRRGRKVEYRRSLLKAFAPGEAVYNAQVDFGAAVVGLSGRSAILGAIYNVGAEDSAPTILRLVIRVQAARCALGGRGEALRPDVIRQWGSRWR